MARRLWPKESPIGQRFRILESATARADWLTVIGIAPDAQLFGIDPSDAEPPAARSRRMRNGEAFSTGLTIRVAGDPAADHVGGARGASRVRSEHAHLLGPDARRGAARWRIWEFGLYGWIFGTIGVVGLLLASVGVYGMLAYSVSQRTQEIGVRVALGADRGHVLKLVVGQGMRLAGLGVVVGLVLAALGTPLARSLLYNVSPFDPFSFIAVVDLPVGVAPARVTCRPGARRASIRWSPSATSDVDSEPKRPDRGKIDTVRSIPLWLHRHKYASRVRALRGPRAIKGS